MLHTRSGRSAVDTRGALDVMVCFKNALIHLHQKLCWGPVLYDECGQVYVHIYEKKPSQVGMKVEIGTAMSIHG